MVTALQAGATSALQAEQREDSTGPDGADDSPEEQAAAEVGVGRLEIAGAGLDVTEEEPLPTTSALWSLPNVVLTPHCAPHTPDLFAAGSAQVFMRNLERYCSRDGDRDRSREWDGESLSLSLENVVDLEKGY